MAGLQASRNHNGQPDYEFPADFATSTPSEQLFTLVNLDRKLYGLPAVEGYVSALNAMCVTGCLNNADPDGRGSAWGYFSANWAGGYYSVLEAYQAWMYADGLGSDNEDCTPSNHAGCWGHRQDVLMAFNPSKPVMMGAAFREDRAGQFYGISMMLAQKQ